jgi:magnesium chelatase subunit D
MDASGSMAGEKRNAAAYLAKHLLLTGKEKVAVVTFQENSSRVVVPFTRNQSILTKGLSTISPAGLTPLAME